MGVFRRALLVLLVLTVLVSSAEGTTFVLCVEPDGATKIEDASNGCCADRRGDAVEPTSGEPSVSDAGCCDCRDIPFPSLPGAVLGGTVHVTGAWSLPAHSSSSTLVAFRNESPLLILDPSPPPSWTWTRSKPGIARAGLQGSIALRC